MLIEKEKDLGQVRELLKTNNSLWIPMYSDPYCHFMNNSISFIYIYCIEDDKQYIIPFRHKDCFNLNIEHLNDRHHLFLPNHRER